MSWTRLSSIPLAATIAVAGISAPADALVAYDARTLGMGGSSVGYATNASLVYWNPAAAANSKNFGLFLPTIGFSLSNNILGVQDAMSLASVFQNPTAGGSTLFSKLGSAEGMNLQVQAMVEPLGFSLGRVGPGALTFRVYGSAMATGQISLSNDFATDLNGLIFQNGFQEIVGAAGSIAGGANGSAATASGQESLKSNVSALKAALNKNMSSFIINGTTKKAATTKSFQADVMSGASAGLGATYAYPVLLPQAVTKLYPESQLTVGATAKVLGTPMGMVPGIPLAGGPAGAQYNPAAGSVSVNLNIDREVTDLLNAVTAYDADPSLANLGDLLGATQDFMGNGLTKTKLQFSSVTPDNVGVGADLGAHFKFDRWWAVGLTMVNPLLLWNAKKTTYEYKFSTTATNPLQLVQVGSPENVAYRVAEPFAVRLGAAFTPQLQGRGPAILVDDILVTAGLDAPLITGTNLPVRPSLHLGAEKLFGPLALRIGTQQLGFSPFYTAGLGIQTRWVQLNVGAATDNPGNPKAAALSANLGVGF